MQVQVALNTQVEIALLWRTLNLVKSFNDEAIQLSFCDEFLRTLHKLPPLALSRVLNANVDTASDQRVEDSETLKIEIPELRYMYSLNFSDLRDPFGLVKYFYDYAEQIIVRNPEVCRRVPISVCLALAVKSGRLNLLLRSACLLLDNKIAIDEFETALIRDVFGYLAIEENGSPLPSGFLTSPFSEQLDEVLDSDDSPEASQGTNHLVLSFGRADHGKLGHGDTQIHRMIPTLVESIQHAHIIEVSSMNTQTFAVATNGNVYLWGPGGVSSLSLGRLDLRPQLLQEAQLNRALIVAVACGQGHALFLAASGNVYARGSGSNGRLGLGDTLDSPEAKLITYLASETIVKVQCGASHSLAVSVKGLLYSWGKNNQGQCGVGHTDDVLKPTLNISMQPFEVSKVAAGWEHSLALISTGALYSWGCGYRDSRRGGVPPVLGHGTSDSRALPQKISSVEGVEIVDVASGWDHCLALDKDGKVLSWGSGLNGKLGHGGEENVGIPCYVSIPSAATASASDDRISRCDEDSVKIVAIAAGCEHSAAVAADGSLFTWGHGEGGRLGHGNNNQRLFPTLVSSLMAMGVRVNHVHCGDKFTVVVCEPQCSGESSSDKESESIKVDKAGITTGVSAYASSSGFYDYIDSVIKHGGEDEGSKVASLHSYPLCQTVLALAARCSLVASKPGGSDRENIYCYADERLQQTGAHLLTLLELHADALCAAMENMSEGGDIGDVSTAAVSSTSFREDHTTPHENIEISSVSDAEPDFSRPVAAGSHWFDGDAWDPSLSKSIFSSATAIHSCFHILEAKIAYLKSSNQEKEVTTRAAATEEGSSFTLIGEVSYKMQETNMSMSTVIQSDEAPVRHNSRGEYENEVVKGLADDLDEKLERYFPIAVVDTNEEDDQGGGTGRISPDISFRSLEKEEESLDTSANFDCSHSQFSENNHGAASEEDGYANDEEEEDEEEAAADNLYGGPSEGGGEDYGDMEDADLQRAILKSMKEHTDIPLDIAELTEATGAPNREDDDRYSYLPSANCLDSTELVIFKLRCCVENVTLTSFKALIAAAGKEGLDVLALRSDHDYAIFSLWSHAQAVMKTCHQHFYPAVENEALLLKILAQSHAFMPMLPGLVAGIQDLVIAGNVIIPLSTEMRTCLVDSVNENAALLLFRHSDHPSVGISGSRRSSNGNPVRLAVSQAYMTIIEMCLGPILAHLATAPAVADIPGHQSSSEAIVAEIDAVDQLIGLLTSHLHADMHAIITSFRVDLSILHVLGRKSFTGKFLPFLRSVFFTRTPSLRLIAIFIRHAKYLLQSLNEHLTRLSSDDFGPLRSFFVRKFRWVIVFMGSSIRMLALSEPVAQALLISSPLLSECTSLFTEEFDFDDPLSGGEGGDDAIDTRYVDAVARECIMLEPWKEGEVGDRNVKSASTSDVAAAASIIFPYFSQCQCLYRYVAFLADPQFAREHHAFTSESVPELLRVFFLETTQKRPHFQDHSDPTEESEASHMILLLHRALFAIMMKASENFGVAAAGGDSITAGSLTNLEAAESIADHPHLLSIFHCWFASLIAAVLVLDTVAFRGPVDRSLNSVLKLCADFFYKPLRSIFMMDDDRKPFQCVSIDFVVSALRSPLMEPNLEKTIDHFKQDTIMVLRQIKKTSRLLLSRFEHILLLGSRVTTSLADRFDGEGTSMLARKVVALVSLLCDRSVLEGFIQDLNAAKLRRSSLALLQFAVTVLKRDDVVYDSFIEALNINMEDHDFMFMGERAALPHSFQQSHKAGFENLLHTFQQSHKAGFGNSQSQDIVIVHSSSMLRELDHLDDAMVAVIPDPITETKSSAMLLSCMRVGLTLLATSARVHLTPFRQVVGREKEGNSFNIMKTVNQILGAMGKGWVKLEAFDDLRYHHLLRSCLETFTLYLKMGVHSNSLVTATMNTDFLNSFNHLKKALSSHAVGSIATYQRLQLMRKKMSLQILHPSTKSIVTTSPSVVPSVFSADGNYSLGFWLFIPKGFDTHLRTTADGFKIHLLSRYPETNEINQISLITNKSQCPCNPSINLEIHDGKFFIIVSVSMQEILDDSIASPQLLFPDNKFSAIHVRSCALKVGEWLLCTVDLQQKLTESMEKVKQEGNKKIPITETLFPDKLMRVARKETSILTLFVNGELVGQAVTVGAASPSYQNVVLGTIPFQLPYSQVLKDLMVADIFWMAPTSSCYWLRDSWKSRGSYEMPTMPARPNPKDEVSAGVDLSSLDSKISSSGDLLHRIMHKTLGSDPPSQLELRIDNVCTTMTSLSMCLCFIVSLCEHVVRPCGSADEAHIVALRTSLITTALPELLDFAHVLLCVGGIASQESAFQLYRTLCYLLPSLSRPAVTDNPIKEAWSHFERRLAALVSLVDHISDCEATTAIPELDNADISQCRADATADDVWRIRCIIDRKVASEDIVASPSVLGDWSTNLTIHENIFFSGLAGILSIALQKGLAKPPVFIDASRRYMTQRFLAFAVSGGLPPFSSPCRFVLLSPNAVAFKGDLLNTESLAFISTAFLDLANSSSSSSSYRFGTQLSRCIGSFIRVEFEARTDESILTSAVLPRGLRSAVVTADLSTALDSCFTADDNMTEYLTAIGPVQNAVKLFACLRDIFAIGQKLWMNPLMRNGSLAAMSKAEALRRKKKGSAASKYFSDGTAAADTGAPSLPINTASFISDLLPEYRRDLFSMAESLAHLRSLAVQLGVISTLTGSRRRNRLASFISILKRDIAGISQLAGEDVSELVSEAFECGPLKSSYVTTLTNLLKDHDVAFLEKIALLVWKCDKKLVVKAGRLLPQHPIDFKDSTISYDSAAKTMGEAMFQMSSLAGDVQITGSKVKALANFPSVCFLVPGITRRTGRWYYECTLLSDGLLQIGWADSLVRCDPSCGQGIGDHDHSWAYDGSRSKKWNGTAENYGRRWKQGDVVGMLLDMDLLEMRFSINGQDLGAAFVGWTSEDMFPALSLNQRQAVRVNFGQFKFSHPPDELDGKAFRAVGQALYNPFIHSNMAKFDGCSETVEGVDDSGSGITRLVSDVKIDFPKISSNATNTNDAGSSSSREVILIEPFSLNENAMEVKDEDGDLQAEAERIRLLRLSAASNSSVASTSSDAKATSTVVMPAEPGLTTCIAAQNAFAEAKHRETDESNDPGGKEADVSNDPGGREVDFVEDVDGEDCDEEDREDEEDRDNDDDEDDEDDDDSGGDEEDDGDHRSSRDVRASRQAMVENLISHGFPVELVLRAAENCETDSESSTFDWMIEQLKEFGIEQLKEFGIEQLKEFGLTKREGDSRAVDDTMDFEDGDEGGLDYLLHRHAQSTRSQLLSSSNLNHTLAILSRGSGGNNLNRIERESVRFGVGGAAANMGRLSDARLLQKAGFPAAGGSGRGQLNLAHPGHGEDSRGAWNADVTYFCVLPGRLPLSYRNDSEKQEALAHFEDIDGSDLMPVIATCQYALCVYYARVILARAIALCLEEDAVVDANVDDMQAVVLSLLHPDEAVDILKMLHQLFRHFTASSRQVADRVFPSIASTSALGDIQERSPLIEPFSVFRGAFSDIPRTLARFEMSLLPHCLGSLLVEESSVSGLQAIETFVKLILGRYADAISPFRLACGNLLSALVNESVLSFERACDDEFEDVDWIEKALLLDGMAAAPPSNESHGDGSSAQKDCKISLLMAYHILRIILMSDAVSLHDCLSPFNMYAASQSQGSASAIGPITQLLSPNTLSKLLRAAMSANSSLKFCAFDISALILSRVNIQIYSSTHDFEVTELMTSLNSMEENAHKSLVNTDERCLPVLAQLQVAAEYYVSISKEKRMLQIFGARMRYEDTLRNHKIRSRYTRSVASFLLQWQLLRRLLGLSTHDYVHQYLTGAWAAAAATILYHHSEAQVVSASDSAAGSPPLLLDEKSLAKSEKVTAEDASAAASKTSQQVREVFKLSVNQISPTSATVSWRMREVATTATMDANQKYGSFSQSDSKCPRQIDSSYGLYIASASNVGMDSASLVLAHIEREGTHRLNDLESDALYKLTIAPMEMPEEQEQAREQQQQQQQDRVLRENVPPPRAPVRDYKHADYIGGDVIADIPVIAEEKAAIEKDRNSDQSRSRSFSLSSERTGDRASSSVSVLIATEAEPSFTLDPDNVSSNLVLSENLLTVRNLSVKKWSTARAAVKMTTGIHRWDVRIDRCISKNIFIGVTTAEAKLDNYVGCDRFGWGFLANKAVWHNKSKLRTFGELFRTGDTVAAVLDLDAGTLSFCLNGRDIGIAVDGLGGLPPLYPSFSLYNEDDQLTILPQRISIENLSWNASSAERILDRLDALQAMLSYFQSGYSETDNIGGTNKSNANREASFAGIDTGDDPSARRTVSSAIPRYLLRELQGRMHQWKRGVCIHSCIWQNDFVSIIMSNNLCANFTNGRLHLGDVVLMDKGRASVLGVSAHRLWVQIELTGEIQGYTADSLLHLLASSSMILLLRSKENFNDLGSFDDSYTLDSETREQSPTALEDSLELLKLLYSQRYKWTRREDEILVHWIDTRAHRCQCSPTSLRIEQLFAQDACGSEASADLFNRYSQEDLELRALLVIHLNDLMLPLLPLISPHDGRSADNHPATILSRCLGLVLQYSKSIFAHTIMPAESSSVRRPLGSVNEIDSPFAATGLVMILPKAVFTLEIEFENTVASRLLHASQSLSEDTLKASSDGQGGTNSGTCSKPNWNLSIGFLLRTNSSWRLVAGFQCSLLGQLYGRIELLASAESRTLESDATKISATRKGSSSGGQGRSAITELPDIWEPLLRGVHCRGACCFSIDLCQCSPPRNRPVTFSVVAKGKLAGGGTGSYTNTTNSWLFELLEARTFAGTGGANLTAVRGDVSIFDIDGHHMDEEERNGNEIISDWSIFSAFAAEAFVQLNRLIDLLYPPSLAEGESSGLETSPYLEELVRFLDLPKDSAVISALRICSLDASDVNVLMQILHAAGVLLGLALRSSVPCMLRLPAVFHRLIASAAQTQQRPHQSDSCGLSNSSNSGRQRESETDVDGMRNTNDDDPSLRDMTQRVMDFTLIAAFAISRGMTSIYAEVVLSLWRESDYARLFGRDLADDRGKNLSPSFVPICCALSRSLIYLRESAIYGPGLSAKDPHVIAFWAALSELSPVNARAILRSLLPARFLSSTSIDPTCRVTILDAGGGNSECSGSPGAPHRGDYDNIDVTDIRLETLVQNDHECALLLPRHRSLRVMYVKLISLALSLA